MVRKLKHPKQCFRSTVCGRANTLRFCIEYSAPTKPNLDDLKHHLVTILYSHDLHLHPWMGFAVLETIKRLSKRQVSRHIERAKIEPFNQVDNGVCSRLQSFDKLVDVLLDYGALRFQRLFRESTCQYFSKAGMVVLLRSHDGAGFVRNFLLEPCPISLKRCMSLTTAIDILPGSCICEAQLVRRDPHDIAVSIMDRLHLEMEVSTME